MTCKARLVLGDCKLALEFLEQATTDSIWRVHWFAAVTLVRTVGDVLEKVDGKDQKYRDAVRNAYVNWKIDRTRNQIFWDFIKDQRDKLVHEYDSDAHPNDKISVLVEFSLASNLDDSKSKHREVYELEDNLYRPMLAGPWEGDDARDVLHEAIHWWEKELDLIDRAANN